MLTTTEEVFFKSALGLARQMEAEGMEVRIPAAFDPGKYEEPTSSVLKRSGLRIVVLLAFGDDSHTVASSAQSQGMSAGSCE